MAQYLQQVRCKQYAPRTHTHSSMIPCLCPNPCLQPTPLTSPAALLLLTCCLQHKLGSPRGNPMPRGHDMDMHGHVASPKNNVQESSSNGPLPVNKVVRVTSLFASLRDTMHLEAPVCMCALILIVLAASSLSLSVHFNPHTPQWFPG